VEAGKKRWEERATRAQERYEDGNARLPEDGDERQRQMTRMGNAAWATGLSYLMLGRRDEAAEWLGRAAERYRESWPEAPPGSWGRPIGAMKSRLLAGDPERAREEAHWALDAGGAESESPIGRYAAALASLVLGDDARAGALAASIEGRDDFPAPVAEALAAVAAADRQRYEKAIRALLADFESREDFLEDVPAADTVLALQSLAAERGIEVALESPLLPVLGT
jgi:tetratricopeptide (TPR) repeat protein